MRYYTVALVGLGTDASPIKPSLPPGVPWVGKSDAAGYLVAVEGTLAAPAVELDAAALRAACLARGLAYADVLSWRLG